MTDGELYDYLQERFGFGSFDEVAATHVPWWKERGTGIAKLKAMMRKRGVSDRDLVIAADYAQRHNEPISYLYQLFKLIPDALREHNRSRMDQHKRLAKDRIQRAASEAYSSGDHDLAERLLRASPTEAHRLLQEAGRG